MNIRIGFSGLLLGCIVVLASGCSNPRDVYRLSAGSEGGSYFAVGSDIADYLNENMDDIFVRPVASTGSSQNLERLKNGEAHMALATLDTVEQFMTENPDVPLCELGVIYIGAAQFVIRTDLVKKGTLSDLQGVRFYPGAKGSGTELSTMRILGSFGIQPEFVPTEERTLGYAEAAQALADGAFDATVLSGGPPVSAMADLMRDHGERFTILNFSQAQQDRAIHEIKGLVPSILPAGVYGPTQRRVVSVGKRTVLIMRYDRDLEATRSVQQKLLEGALVDGRGLRSTEYHPLLRRLTVDSLFRPDAISPHLKQGTSVR